MTKVISGVKSFEDFVSVCEYFKVLTWHGGDDIYNYKTFVLKPYYVLREKVTYTRTLEHLDEPYELITLKEIKIKELLKWIWKILF